MLASALQRPVVGPCRLCRTASLAPRWAARPAQRTRARSQTEEKSTPKVVSKSAEEDVPLWVKREQERKLQKEQGGNGPKDLPWPLYLLLSLFTSIASIGSVFEYLNHNPVFGVVPPDSPAWAPILGFFALSGIPSAGFFFFKGVTGANEAADLQDRLDGYTDDKR